jgi:DNA (cytosine-5)-methyltransferase 1
LKLLDGCCGAGGAARGYATAGFEVHGADANPKLARDYLKSGAVTFTRADILVLLGGLDFIRQFSVVHVSPPCQHYSQMARCRPGLAATYPDLIGPVRELLERSGVPYVIENVGAARPWLKDPVTLCGVMFGRPVYRHRLFEAGNGITLHPPVMQPGCTDDVRPNRECGWPHPVPAAKAGHWKPGMYVSVAGHERKEPVRAAMGIDWVSDREAVKEAVAPYMTEYIGRQVMDQLCP